MSIKEIQTAIAQLPREELVELTSWLADFHHQVWDKQIEDDLEAGKLDALLAQVDQECQSGLAKPL